MSDPAVISPDKPSEAPRQRTNAAQQATVTDTIGESSDFTRRAFNDASTVSRLASARRLSSSSCRPNALTTRIEVSPSWTTSSISLCLRRTSRVAFFTARRNRATNSSRNGATATAISAKSQLSQNISPSIPAIVSRSMKMLRVDEEAKPWIVSMSSEMVLSSAPVGCVS